MEEIDKLRKKLRKEAEKNIDRLPSHKEKANLEKKQGESELFDIDDSDIPIHEKFVSEEHIKQIKKKKKSI